MTSCLLTLISTSSKKDSALEGKRNLPTKINICQSELTLFHNGAKRILTIVSPLKLYKNWYTYIIRSQRNNWLIDQLSGSLDSMFSFSYPWDRFLLVQQRYIQGTASANKIKIYNVSFGKKEHTNERILESLVARGRVGPQILWRLRPKDFEVSRLVPGALAPVGPP